MASLEVSRPTAQTVPGRNPRRRTRQEIEGGSLRLGQPQRKRSKLANGNASHADTNGSPDGVVKPHMNGHASLHGRQSVSPALSTIPYRGSGASHRRDNKSQGLDILTKNERYYIGKLPNFPSQLRDNGEDYRACSLPSTTLTLALTRQRAIIWDIAKPNAGNAARMFSLPHPSKVNEPLPLGALVRSGLDTDTGLVVVTPRSGKVTFWENIENADALSLFQQRRNGTEGSLGSMLSCETVTNITSADNAGFVVAFSSGRVAQLLLRDAQSRPAISVTFLKSNKSSAGLFSGLWNVLGSGGFLKDVAAVRCRPSRTRGSTDVILATEEAAFQYWRCSWSGQPSLEAETNGYEPLAIAAKEAMEPSMPSEIQHVILLDCVISSAPSRVQNALFRLLALVQVSGASCTSYALADLEIIEHEPLAVYRILPLHSYAPPLTSSPCWRPRLCVSPQTSTAFAVFDKAICIVAMPSKEEPKDQQHDIYFQDTVYLKDDEDLYVTGVDALPQDSRSASASVTIHVRHHGSLRFIVDEQIGGDPDNAEEELSVRGKIEQAVFYGDKPSSPFNLSRKPDSAVVKQKVEDAVLAISKDVLSSEYQDVLPDTSSVEIDLQRRAKALTDLARHVKFAYPGLSKQTRWQLCWDAEKMAAARKLWSNHDRATQAVAEREMQGLAPERELLPISDQTRLLPEIIHCMGYENKSLTEEEEDRVDQLRIYLRRDIWRLDSLLTWTYREGRDLVKRETQVADCVYCDAGEIILDTLGTAFTFRADNAWLYGLDDVDAQGILRAGYEDLPDFWTSTGNKHTFTAVWKLIQEGQDMALKYLPEAEEQDMAISEAVSKFCDDNPALINVYSRVNEERYLYSKAQTEQQTQDDAQAQYDAGKSIRTRMMKNLAELEQADAGIQLAEAYNDMDALTTLIAEETGTLMAHSAILAEEPPDESLEAEQERLHEQETTQVAIAALEARIHSNCVKYGYAWTKYWYSSFIKNSQFSSLLDQTSSYRKWVTEFLRKEPGRQRLAWINEVLNEDYCYAAGTSLISAATGQSEAWNKQICSSFSKLALLAADEADPGQSAYATHETAYKAATGLVKIQQLLSDHIKPSTYNGLDTSAMLELAMEVFSTQNVDEHIRPKLRQLLTHGFECLIEGQAMDAEVLVDVLTLIDDKPSDLADLGISGQQYYYALDALRNGSETLDAARTEMLRLLVWRRCYLADDWASINNTDGRSDEQVRRTLTSTVLFSTFCEAYQHDLLDPQVAGPAPFSTLTAGTTTHDYLPRFSSADLAEPIALDTCIETGDLQSLLDESRLEYWIESTRDLAWQAVQHEKKFVSDAQKVASDYVRDQARKEMLAVKGMDRMTENSDEKGREKEMAAQAEQSLLDGAADSNGA